MTKLSEYMGDRKLTGSDSILDMVPDLVYRTTGKPFTGTVKRIEYGEPIRYFDAQGQELIPAVQEYPDRDPMQSEALTFLRNVEPGQEAAFMDETDRPSAWNGYSIDLETVKAFLKLETDADDPTLAKITDAAIAIARKNTDPFIQEIPADVELAILQTVAFWYENRGDQNIPSEAREIFQRNYRFPGL